MKLNMNKKSMKVLLFVIVLGLLAWAFMGNMPAVSKSTYEPAPVVTGEDLEEEDEYASADLSNSGIDLNLGCAMKSGVGLASSLLPREMASQEDFGQFAPDDILKGQNYLDPRNQIGIPETIGGAIRNANQQIRADPPNPKAPYTWNNSTIVPDLMQRDL
jgi:hypothetical protein